MNPQTDPDLSQEQLHNLKQHLIQSQRMVALGIMTAGIAHELNNPIGYITNNLAALQDYMHTLLPLITTCLEYANTEPGTELRNRIQPMVSDTDLDFILTDIKPLLSDAIEGSAKLGNIVSSLKQFGQNDSVGGELFDLNQCVNDSLQLLRKELKYKATIYLQQNKLPALHGFPKEINQVIINLLLNATQAITDWGDITIETRATTTEVVLNIKDTGEGITEKNLQKLFAPFFTTHTKNIGLGLYISHEIIQAHKGSIKVESHLGSGTSFTITLPIPKFRDDKIPEKKNE